MYLKAMTEVYIRFRQQSSFQELSKMQLITYMYVLTSTHTKAPAYMYV